MKHKIQENKTNSESKKIKLAIPVDIPPSPEPEMVELKPEILVEEASSLDKGKLAVKVEEDDEFHIDNRLKCDKCNYSTTDPSNIKRHSIVHYGFPTDPFQCDQCNYSTSRPYALTYHKLKYHCPSGVFPGTEKQPSNTENADPRKCLSHSSNVLKSDKDTGKPFKCQQCGSAFIRSRGLKLHQRKCLSNLALG